MQNVLSKRKVENELKKLFIIVLVIIGVFILFNVFNWIFMTQ
ncbi:hypothetical protein [Halalkalibacter lacteus]